MTAPLVKIHVPGSLSLRTDPEGRVVLVEPYHSLVLQALWPAGYSIGRGTTLRLRKTDKSTALYSRYVPDKDSTPFYRFYDWAHVISQYPDALSISDWSPLTAAL